MRLYIDTSDKDKIIVKLNDKRFVSESRQEKSQRLLPFIDEILKKEGKTIKDITEIKVYTKRGSFTGLRVGVTVAETLGWVLKIPVNGKMVYKGETIDINYSK